MNMDAEFSPDVQMDRLDVVQTLVLKEDVPQEQIPGDDQQDQEHLHIKEKREEFWTILKEETSTRLISIN
ncbi:hypothetical protein ILYODFUR_017501 [Ilyodon furcidens]|uniref:Uncharacterized protein n=1 Tax=Ilyodon furcidens TaxID=33524 RepID=A0ABV0UVM3_9TELE